MSGCGFLLGGVSSMGTHGEPMSWLRTGVNELRGLLKEDLVRRVSFLLSTAALFLFGVAAPGAADPKSHFKVNQQVPLAGFQVQVPCTGDTITFTEGFLHDMFHLTVNGSHFSITSHDQPHGLK